MQHSIYRIARRRTLGLRALRRALLCGFALAAMLASLAAAQTIAQTVAPIPRRPESAGDMLVYFDVDESLLRQFIDHRPLHEDEREALAHVMYALPKLPAEEVVRWIKQPPDWQSLIDAPQDHRTEMFHLTGRVKRVEKFALIPELAERYEFGHYYVADVRLGADELSVAVCTREIPKAWKLDEAIDEAVSFDGMFLKLGDKPIFAAKRLAWHPNKLDEAAHIGPDQVFLGDLEMDVGLWDNVVDRSGLVGGDREAFYSLLAAMGNTKPANLAEKSTTEFDFADLLRTPEKFHGRLLTVEGTARRAAKIIVSDEDIRQRFGIDHYYEVYVFVQLQKKIVFKKGEEQLEYNSFPVACCVRQLPPGMDEGDNIRQNVRISGAFLKLWLYESPQMTQFDPRQMQPSPMLIGLEPELIPDTSPPNEYLGAIIGSLFVVALIGAWIFVWRFNVADAKFEKQTLNRKYELPKGESLNKLALDDRGVPDFSHLEKHEPQPEGETAS
jgi:hypothetical protein